MRCEPWTALVAVVACIGLAESRREESKITFKPPTLTEEESESLFMPDQLKCDGCRAIAFQLYAKLMKFHSGRRSNYIMKESEILDLTESFCEDRKEWDRYAIKEVDGVKRLSGEGLEAAQMPGVLAGGGKWPSRLADMCMTYMGELGEMAVYNAYKKDSKNAKVLEKYLCRGEGLRGECTKAESHISRDEL